VTPVGAGEGVCGEGTLASPWEEEWDEGAASVPTPLRTTPAPTNLTISPQKPTRVKPLPPYGYAIPLHSKILPM